MGNRPGQRHYSLDWLRVIAFGLLILFHTGMKFVSWNWHLKNPETSVALEWVMRLLRTRRRQIVNLNFVKELTPWAHGDYLLILADGQRLPLGRRYRRRFLELFA
jgi:hypothetical protein